jgi:GNAT superfamily N-acetyltransferase
LGRQFESFAHGSDRGGIGYSTIGKNLANPAVGVFQRELISQNQPFNHGRKKKMTIRLSEQLPDKDEYFALFNTTGWNADYRASAEDLERTNRNSWLSLSAYEGDRLVGFGRVVTDFVLHAMIYDMIVLPEYQGQGIGTLILQALLKRCKEQGIKDIQLFCAKGKRTFYERNGFVARAEDAPGMQQLREKYKEKNSG